MIKHTEQVGRYRVMRQMTLKEYNPEGIWTLHYSSNSEEDANEVMAEWAGMIPRDNWKVVDNGVETTREVCTSIL